MACAPGNLAIGGTGSDVPAKHAAMLSFTFNNEGEISISDPRGRVLHFGRDVPEWRNEFGGSANFSLLAGQPQVHISDPPAGVWKIGVALKRDMRVLSLQGFTQGFTSRGCPVDDNIGPVQGGYTYGWQLRLKMSTAPDTCVATLSRTKPLKLSR